MTETEFDKLLRSALMEAVWQDFSPAIEAAEHEEITFSERYLKRREKMLQDPFTYAKKATLTLLQRVARMVAMLLLVCSILFAVAMTVPEVRAALKRLYMEWYETHIAVYVQEPANDDASIDLSSFHVEIPVEVLPDGYREVVCDTYAGCVKYLNRNNDMISVDYWYMEGAGSLGVNNLEIANVNQIIDTVEYCLFEALSDDHANQVMWINAEYNLVIGITAPREIDMDSLLNIAVHTVVGKNKPKV